MKQHRINFKLLTKTAILPTKGSSNAAGRDLYADLGNTSISINPHSTAVIPLGFATEFPENWVALVFIRSGVALKKGLRLANCVGVIDADYRGEWKLLIYNDTAMSQVIEPGEKIAQVIFMKYKDIVPIPVTELNETERGDGGFGSTGER
jgi:dUTP pyrophosphatase